MVPLRTSRKYTKTGAPVRNQGVSRCRLRAGGIVPLVVARAVLTVAPSIVATGLAGGAEPERPEDVVEMVIRAIAHNYEQIKTAEATIESVDEEDPSRLAPHLRGPDPEREKKSNVHTVARLRPRMMEHVIIRGEELRHEVDRGDGPSEITVRKKGQVSRYARATKQMSIRRPADLHRPLMDPRETGSVNTSIGFADLLRSSELVEAELINRGDSTAVARVVVKYGRGDRVEFQFDSSTGFLPTLKTVTRPDGSLKSCLEVSYQDVLGGKARFLKEAVTRFFPPGATKIPLETGWHQRIRHAVTDLRINQPVDDSAFEIDVPVGTRVVNRITKKWYVYGEESPETRASSRHLIWCGAGIGLLMLLAVVMYLRSRKRIPSFH